MPTNLRKLLVGLGLTVLSLALVLFTVEIVIRQTTKYWTLDMAAELEPAIFSRYVFPEEKQTIRRYSNPSEKITINAQGYRSDTFSIPKPEEQIRILLYGGSQAFDHTGVERGWPNRAEELLRQRGFERVRIINASAPGHASFDSLGKLFSKGHFLEPDYVILSHAGNDLKYFHKKGYPIREVEPYRKESNPRRYYQNDVDRFLGEHSQFYTLLRQYTLRFYRKYFVEKEPLPDPKDYQINPRARRQFQLTLSMMADLSERVGSELIYMPPTRLITRETIESNLPARIRWNIRLVYENMPLEYLLNSFRTIEKLYREVGEREEVPLWTPGETMNGRRKYFVDHAHFSEEGSRQMARILADHVERMITRNPDTSTSTRSDFTEK